MAYNFRLNSNGIVPAFAQVLNAPPMHPMLRKKYGILLRPLALVSALAAAGVCAAPADGAASVALRADVPGAERLFIPLLAPSASYQVAAADTPRPDAGVRPAAAAPISAPDVRANSVVPADTPAVPLRDPPAAESPQQEMLVLRVDERLLAGGARRTALAVIPLGTGNDLARTLGWSPLTSERDLEPRLAALASASERRLDGWQLVGPGFDRAWFNYWSIGADARTAWRFDRLRRHRPWLLRSPAINRVAYALLGAVDRGPHPPLLGAGGKPLPAWAAAVVLASIPSYAGGVRLSRTIDPADGRLEVFALGAQVAMGLVAARLRRPRLIDRANGWELVLARPAPMQVDGEPFIATAGRYCCRHAGTIGVLVAR